MALAIIRQFTDDDRAALNASSQRFASRHGLTLDLDDAEPFVALDQLLWMHDTGTWPHVKTLKRLWQACRCRALGVAVAADISVGYGYVGRHVA